MKSAVARWTLALVAALAPACATPQAAGGQGDPCYRMADCVEGLVCVRAVCTSRIDDIVGESPPSAQQDAGAGGAAPDGAATTDASSTGPDASAPPPPGDAGALPPDAGVVGPPPPPPGDAGVG